MVNNFKYKRINIQTKYSDDTVGPLIIPIKNCYSFGLQKNVKYEGYSLPIVVDDEFVKIFHSVVGKCKKHLVKVSKEIDLTDYSFLPNSLVSMLTYFSLSSTDEGLYSIILLYEIVSC